MINSEATLIGEHLADKYLAVNYRIQKSLVNTKWKSDHFINSSLFPEVSHQAWLLDTRGVSVLSSGSSVKAFRSRIYLNNYVNI